MGKKFGLFALIILLFLIYWIWWLPGPRVANDFPVVSQPVLQSGFDLPRAWTEAGASGLGEYRTFTLWAYPTSLIAGILASAGLSFNLLERIVLLIPFLFIGVFSIWKYGKSIHLSDTAKFFMSLFYLSNTYILLIIDGGQILIGLAYSLLPLCFLMIEKSIHKGLREKTIAGILISALGFFDFRFIYVLFLLILLRFFYELFFLRKEEWVHWIFDFIKLGVISTVIFFGMNFYWVFPLLLSPLSSGTYKTLTGTSFTYFTSLGLAMLLISPHWFKNIFGNISNLRPEFIFIPIFVFLSPILRPKNKIVCFWLLIAIVSIFLAKGSLEPLPNIYSWLFNHVPGFSLFRDSTKFFFLIALSYSILIGITVDEVLQKLRNLRKIKILFVIVLTIYFLYLIKPVFLNQMTGTFSIPSLQNKYSRLSTILKNDNMFSRVFWIPATPPLGYVSTQHPSVEAARLYQLRPFAVGIKGAYENFNFLREARYMGEIFDVSGIGYIAYPYLNSKGEYLNPENVRYYYTFLDQLSNRPWISKVNDSPVPLLKTNNHQDKFFITPNIWWVIGSDSLYNDATKSAKLKLSKNALIFADEYPEMGKGIDKVTGAKIVLNNKTDLDLVASFINSADIFFPASNLHTEPDKSGWWKRDGSDLIKWRDFLQTKYGIDNQDFDLSGGWAVGEGNLELKISHLSFGDKNSEIKKDKILIARVMESSRSGELKFYQGNEKIGEVSTKSIGRANIRWFDIGKLISSDDLIIKTEGDINVVNALAILDQTDLQQFEEKVKTYHQKGKILEFTEENAQDSAASVTYRQINPTKYEISIRGLTKPAFLVFSENYDKLWKIENQNSIPVFSILNGFSIKSDGDYTIEFEPQMHVNNGLIVTGITVAVIIVLFLKKRKTSSDNTLHN